MTLGQILDAWLTREDRNARYLARKAGVSPQTVYAMLAGTSTGTPESRTALCGAMGLTGDDALQLMQAACGPRGGA